MKGQVYLLDSGSMQVAKVNAPMLIDGMARPAEYAEICKAIADSPKSVGSKRIRDRYGITLDGVTCAARPFDFYIYAYATSLNTYHARACRAKVKDIVGRKWKIAGDGNAAVKARIEGFFKGAFGQMGFSGGMGNVWMDYEALGNGFLEVIPSVKGDEPAELSHLPAPETWIRLDNLGFVQQKNGEYSHFRAWGLPEEKFAGLRPNDPLLAAEVTSIIHFSRYFPWSLYYGIPCIMPAWNRLALVVLESEFNLNFFSNNAIPDYAVILEGDWEDGAEDTIKEYFRTHLKGQAHKTMVLQTPKGNGWAVGGGKITFEKLTSDNAKEGSFRLLRQDCRDEILNAHGVPPSKVGIVVPGRLGTQGDDQMQEYSTSIVQPGVEMVTTRLNRLIENGFGAPEFTIQFETYSPDDRAQNATVDSAYLDRKVLAPNEVRRIRFPDLPPLVGGDEVIEPAGAADPATEAALGGLQKKLSAISHQLSAKASQ